MKETRKKSSLTLFTVILLVFLAIYVVTLVAPFLWALLTSLKEQRDFRLNIIGLPKEWAWANYPYVFENFSVLVDIRFVQKLHVRDHKGFCHDRIICIYYDQPYKKSDQQRQDLQKDIIH